MEIPAFVPVVFKKSVMHKRIFQLGIPYRTINGNVVTFVKINNPDTSYETVEDEHGVNRYSRRDYGRVTGRPTWWPENIAIDRESVICYKCPHSSEK